MYLKGLGISGSGFVCFNLNPLFTLSFSKWDDTVSCREDLVCFRGLGMSGCGFRLFQNPLFLLLFFRLRIDWFSFRMWYCCANRVVVEMVFWVCGLVMKTTASQC